MDGTLIKTDLLWEAIVIFLKSNPLNVVLLLWWVLQGKKAFKLQLSKKVSIDPKCLPYNHRFIAYLKEEKEKGRKIFLVSGSAQVYVQAVADEQQLFDEVHGSTQLHNLVGQEKAQYIRALLGDETPFIYAGNDRVDTHVWASADEGVVVRASAATTRKAKSCTQVNHIFSEDENGAFYLIKAMRLHQWVKNLLIFLPALMLHALDNWDLVFSLGFAFLAYCLCASSVYILNDLLDLNADRMHVTKCTRPFAAGNLDIKIGIMAGPILLIAAVFCAWKVSFSFLLMLVAYYLVTVAYSFKLKELLLIDVLTLSLLYNWRILSGAVVVNAVLSPWFLGFTGFLFFSLALAKRSSELQLLKEKESLKVKGRDYYSQDLNQVNILGSGSGLAAVLILALHINSQKVQLLYPQAFLLWFVCIACLYWIARLWMLTGRGLLTQDPIEFALKDPPSYIIGIASLVLLFLATFTF